MSLRRWALRAATLGVAAIALVTVAAPAWAHSELERSDPPQGGMVAPGRTSLRLWFQEQVGIRASTFELSGPDGTRVAVRPVGGESGGALQLQTDPLPKGLYHLEWRVLSLEDGHQSSGTLVFGAGLRPTLVPEASAGLPPAEVTVLRWTDLAALLLAIGVLAVSGRVLGALGQIGEQPRRRARTIGVAAALLSAYVVVITPFVRSYASGNLLDDSLRDTWATLLETSWGHLWLARGAIALLAAAVTWTWSRRGGLSPTLARLAMALLAGSALLEAMAGHASSLSRLSAIAVLVSAAHIIAAGVWAGGLGVLVLCLVPLMRRTPEVRRVVLSSAWRTFSPMAAVASVVLLATGLYEAGRHVPDLASLAGSVYGGAVAAKTLMLALAFVLAGLHLMAVNPHVQTRLTHLLGRSPSWAPVSGHRFTTTVTLEAVALLAAAGLAAVLTTTPTAREVEQAGRVTAVRTDAVDGLFVTFEHIAAGADRSRVVVRVRSTVRPPPAPVDGVDVTLTAPDGAQERVRLLRVDQGRFEGGTTLSGAGRWSAVMNVHRRGLPDTVTRARWSAESPSGASATRLEMVSTVLAGGLVLGLLAVLARGRRRPDRRAPAPPAPKPEELSLR